MSTRAFSKLVAGNGLVPSLTRSRDSWSRSRNFESSSAVRQLLKEASKGTKFPSSIV